MTRASCQYSTPTPKWQERAPPSNISVPPPILLLPFPSSAAVVGSFFGTMPNLSHCVVRPRASRGADDSAQCDCEGGALALAISSDRSHTIELSATGKNKKVGT